MIPLGRRDPCKVVGSIEDEYKDSGVLGFDAPCFRGVVGVRKSQYCKILEVDINELYLNFMTKEIHPSKELLLTSPKGWDSG